MRGLMRRVVDVAVAAVMLLVPAAGVAGAAGVAAAGMRLAAGARAVSGGTWGRAIEVPGTAALNTGGDAEIHSVSCAAAGNCSAGGLYADGSEHVQQAFVVSQVNGTWRKAEQVPGTAALNRGGNATVSAVSCASAGNCSAGGTYRRSGQQAFVVSQVHGAWDTAIEVPGTAALNTGGNAQIISLSCGAAGNCSAGGDYTDSTGHAQAFVVSQVGGTWHTAIEVPGTAALNRGGGAEIAAVSCGAAGNCSAGGDYTDISGNGQVFVVGQVNGTWHTAIEVPGTAALNQASAQITSVSCAAAANCSAGGLYADNHGRQAFVDSET